MNYYFNDEFVNHFVKRTSKSLSCPLNLGLILQRNMTPTNIGSLVVWQTLSLLGYKDSFEGSTSGGFTLANNDNVVIDLTQDLKEKELSKYAAAATDDDDDAAPSTIEKNLAEQTIQTNSQKVKKERYEQNNKRANLLE